MDHPSSSKAFTQHPASVAAYAARTQAAPENMNVEDLLAHLAAHFQEVRRRELPDLIALARKVERVHHDVAEAPLGLADALERLSDELDMHMAVEEEVLFSAMLQDLQGAIHHPIQVMRGEHADYAREVDQVEALARNFVVPDGACGSWHRLYEGAARLCAGLREQIRIENEVLFPRFEIAKMRCTCAHG